MEKSQPLTDLEASYKSLKDSLDTIRDNDKEIYLSLNSKGNVTGEEELPNLHQTWVDYLHHAGKILSNPSLYPEREIVYFIEEVEDFIKKYGKFIEKKS